LRPSVSKSRAFSLPNFRIAPFVTLCVYNTVVLASLLYVRGRIASHFYYAALGVLSLPAPSREELISKAIPFFSMAALSVIGLVFLFWVPKFGPWFAAAAWRLWLCLMVVAVASVWCLYRAYLNLVGLTIMSEKFKSLDTTALTMTSDCAAIVSLVVLFYICSRKLPFHTWHVALLGFAAASFGLTDFAASGAYEGFAAAKAAMFPVVMLQTNEGDLNDGKQGQLLLYAGDKWFAIQLLHRQAQKHCSRCCFPLLM